MLRSPQVSVSIDLGRIRANVLEISTRTRVPVMPVIKADAYGLGAVEVAQAIRDLVASFCVFRPQEMIDSDLWRRTARPAIAIGPPASTSADDYRSLHLRPAVSNMEQAAALRAAAPLVCVDTGQQRFACPADQVEQVIRAGGCDEAFTHATSLEQVHRFQAAVSGKVSRLHAAGSALLECPEAWLDGVRPGLAIYRGAARVSVPLAEVYQTNGPAGYTGFTARFHGVILAGYSNGLRPGPCLINGQKSRILEVGMQSAFVELRGEERRGDEVLLLGDSLTEQEVAHAWNMTPQEALLRLTGLGVRSYRH